MRADQGSTIMKIHYGIALAMAVSAASCGVRDDRIAAYGSIEAEETLVSFQVQGTIAEKMLDEGEPVFAGQVLARLDTLDLHSQVELGMAGLDRALAELSDLESGYRSEEIGQAAALLDEARAVDSRAGSDLERQAALLAAGAVSQSDYDAALAASRVSRASVEAAQQQVSMLLSGYTEGRLAAAAASARAAEATLSLARSNLDKAVLRSPLTGLVLEDYIERGEFVSPGTPAFSVSDLDTVFMRAYLEEPLLGRVSPGARALVTVDSWPGESFEGVVGWISSEAEFTPTQIQTGDERTTLVFEMRIEIPNPGRKLLPGMPAEAAIEPLP